MVCTGREVITMKISRAYNKKTGVTYVYEVLENHWDPDLKQARNKRRLIGKIDPITGDIVKTGKRGPQKKSTEEDVRQMQEKYRDTIQKEREKSTKQQSDLQDMCLLMQEFIQMERQFETRMQALLAEHQETLVKMELRVSEILSGTQDADK